MPTPRQPSSARSGGGGGRGSGSTPRRTPRRAAATTATTARGGGSMSRKNQAEIKTATTMESVDASHSPGGSKRFDVTVHHKVTTSSAGGAGGSAGAMSEAERLEQWKAQMAADDSSDLEDERETGAADADDPAAAEILQRYGLQSEEPQSFRGEFSWNGFSQVKTITEQNQSLVAQLDEKDREIDRLLDVIEATAPIPGLDPAKLLDVRVGTELVDQDARDLKVMELAKKARKLTVAVQREQARVAAMQEERDKYKDIAESKVYPQRLRDSSGGGKTPDAADTPLDHEEMAKLKQQNRMLSSRLGEYRVKADRYETEMKKARAALQKEVGPTVNLEKVIEGGTNWRGRAQKIVMLRSRVRELEEHVKEHTTRAGVDQQAKMELQQMEEERRRGIEQITEDFAATQQELEKEKRKAAAAKARVRVLEREHKKAKDGVQTLLKKTTTDDQLIDALRKEVQENRRTISNLNETLRSTQMDLTRTTSVHGAKVLDSHEYERLTRQNSERARQLEHQEKIIASLRGELRNARSNRRNSGQSGNMIPRAARPTSAELRKQAGNDLEKEYAMANMKMLQLENTKQLELVALLKTKLQEAEANEEHLAAKAAHLQSQVAEYEAESGSQRGSRKGNPKSMAALQAKIKALTEENSSLRQSFRSGISARDDEVKLLKSQMATMEKQFAEQLRSIQGAAERAGKASSSKSAGMGGMRAASPIQTSESMRQLEADNEILKRELSDMRARYQQMNARQRTMS